MLTKGTALVPTGVLLPLLIDEAAIVPRVPAAVRVHSRLYCFAERRNNWETKINEENEEEQRIRTTVVLFVEDNCGEKWNQLIDQIQSEFSPGQFVKLVFKCVWAGGNQKDPR